MSSSKKVLLAKLKKDMASKKAAASKKPTSPIVIEDAADIHRDLVDRVLGAGTEEEFRTILQTHVNFFPNDRVLLKVMTLTREDRVSLFTQVKESSGVLLDAVRAFIASLPLSSTDPLSPPENTLLQELKNISNPSVSTLIALDDEVFDPVLTLEFYSDSSETEYCTAMVNALLSDLSILNSTNREIKMYVYRYLYNHRYDEILGLLQNPNISDADKQVFVTEHIKNQYESTRSKQFFVLIWALVEKRTYPFRKQLDNLLFRFIQDKKFLPQIRKSLTLALDILIHNDRTDKYLSKFFLTKAGLQKFKTMTLPMLSNHKQSARYIRSIIRNDFEHSYLYQHAHQITWKTYLSIFQDSVGSSSLVSIETRLISSLNHSRSIYADKIMRLLQSSTEEMKSIRSVVFQFISTFKPSERKELGKLLTLPRPGLVKFFENTLAVDYMKQIQDVEIVAKETPKKKTVKTVQSWGSMESEYRIFLEKSRVEIMNFRCILLRPVHDISDYSDRAFDADSSYILPNEKFYHDCVYGSSKQNKTIFQLNGVDMQVYYYLVSKEIVLQDEAMFEKHAEFVTNQVKVNDSKTPFEYFREFSKLPLLNHNSEVMTKLRQSIVSRLDELQVVHGIEEQVFFSSSSLQEYLQTISRILLVTDTIASPFFSKSKYFVHLLKTGYVNRATLPELLMSGMENAFCVLYPEYFMNGLDVQPILLNKARVQVQRIFFSLLLRAFTIENPMSRLPILPTEMDILDKSLLDIKPVTDFSKVYISYDQSVDLAEAHLLTDVSTFFHKDPVLVESDDLEIDAVEDRTVIGAEPVAFDPFHSFLQVALDHVDEL